MLSETFSGTAITPGYDANGNLTDDGTYKYTYDAWNRLVKVTAKQDTDITLQTAKYDGLGRRLEKVVTNSGDHDATWRYYYHGHQIIQANDGSGNLLMEVYHGTLYIDEVVAMRLPHGRAYVHQDANWNVTSLTDLTGAVLERYYYSPYGQVEVVAETYFGDYDGDGFVDSDDADDLCSNGEGCACEFTSSVSGDCRVFDFDCDGDLDATDESTLSALYTGLSADMQNRRIPSTTFSPAGNVFGHQGLVLDVEIRSYQNRNRQYAPKLKRFMQRDPLGIFPGLPSIFDDGTIRAATRSRIGPQLQYVDGSNVYSYLDSRPLFMRDPNGLCAPDCPSDWKWTGVFIYRTPFCDWPFGSMGHTWIELWGGVDFLDFPDGWIGSHACQLTGSYIELSWRACIPSAMLESVFIGNLEAAMADYNDEHTWSFWDNCRDAVDSVISTAGGVQIKQHFDDKAECAFCRSECGKNTGKPKG